MLAASTVIKITEICGTGMPVEGNDIDTDRIIPARFLKEITFSNMGKYAFYDERFDEKGNLASHPFNDPDYADASILIVNKNFGCGSSREHAPQAIMRSGIKAIIGESFAEIFSGNCTVLGMPTATLGESQIAKLIAAVKQHPKIQLKLSVTDKKLSYGDTILPVSISEVVLKALSEGTWDSTQLMLANLANVRKTGGRLPYMNKFRSESM